MATTIIETERFVAVKQLIQSVTGPEVQACEQSCGGRLHCTITLTESYGGNILLIESKEPVVNSDRLILCVRNLREAHASACELGLAFIEEFIDSKQNQLSHFQIDNVEIFLVRLHTDSTADVARVQCSTASQVYTAYIHRFDVEEQTVKGTIAVPSPVKRTWNPPAGTLLSTVRLRVLHDGEYQPMHANTVSPVRFSTALFEGQVQLFVNSSEEAREPFRTHFQKNKYKFELQIQGKFKEIPSGPIYFGGEITKKMELGMITRGICGGLLQLGRSANAYMHHSFGDKARVELPHIVGPFWSTVDRLVVTPAGEEPPPFLLSFPEEQKRRTARKANPAYTLPVDMSSTYSFSMKTGMMNLEEWAIETTFTKAMSLNTFWADADLRFACYCIPAGAQGVEFHSNGQPKLHPQRSLQHFFSLEIQHISNHTDWPADELSFGGSEHHRPLSNKVEHVEQYQPCEEAVMVGGAEADGNTATRESECTFASSIAGSEEEDEFHDAVEGDSVAFRTSDPSVLTSSDQHHQEDAAHMQMDMDMTGDADQGQEGEETERVSNLLKEKLAMLQERIMSHTTRHTLEPGTGPYAKTRLAQNDQVAISSVMYKRSLVAAVIEVDDCRAGKRGSRRKMFAFLSNPADDPRASVAGSGSPARRATGRRYVLHSYGEWKQSLQLIKLPPQPPCYARYSEDLKRKAALSWSYECILNGTHRPELRPTLSTFLDDCSNNDTFLAQTGYGVGAKKLRVNLPGFSMECMACVQLGNFSWSEECMGITGEELIFIKPCKRLGTAVRLRIPLKDLLSVRKVSDADNPLPIPGFHCLLIATFAKQYTVVLRGLDTRDSWVGALQSQSYYLSSAARSMSRDPAADTDVGSVASPQLSLRRTSTTDSTGGWGGNNASFSISNIPASSLEGMVVYPPDWQLGDRMILNGRNFTCSGVYHQLSMRTLELGQLVSNPCALVERLLDMAFRLAQFATADEVPMSPSVGASAYGSSNYAYNMPRSATATSPTATSAAGAGAGAVDPEQLWVDFLDGVALLQCIDLSIVDNTSPEAACLFLNLYHCMLLHAYMVVGLPNSLFKWSNFFRFCSYEAFGDIFSLAELEHCIMRSGMSRPNINFLAQHFLIPNLEYSFALKVRDYRLLWGIFCGATSNVSEIPIYRPELLDAQLNSITKAGLSSELSVQGNTVTLPVLCQLYAKEFDPAHLAAAPSKAVLKVLQKHLSGDQWAAVQSLIDRKGSFSVKYSPFNFQCKYPTRLQDKGVQSAAQVHEK